jgi:hypothetical protein
MYQLGLVRHAGSVTGPPRASTPHGTCESAMNPAGSVANDAWNLSRSKNRKPSLGGKIGGCGPSGAKPEGVSHQTGQESRSMDHRAAPSVTDMCITTKHQRR